MRGFLFSLDALLAGLLLISGLLLLGEISQHSSDTTQLSSAGEDVLASLSSIQVWELQDPWVIANIQNDTISDENITVLEQLGYFWATGHDSEASELGRILLSNQYPGYGLRLSIEGSTFYERNSTKGNKDILVSTRMISGIAQGEAITGSSAVAYLRRIKDKRTQSFTSFGGFVGQGNLTVLFLDLPADANITDIRLELAAGAPFTVAFNSIPCGGTYTSTVYNGTPGSWDLTTCNSSFIKGAINTVNINFSTSLNSSYVSGGYLRVKYKTATLVDNRSSSFVQYRFPGIDGIINLYDAFYVPGTLLNMSIYLHYNTTNSSYLDIGEKRVWEDDANGTEKIVILNDTYLRNATLGKLDYDFLSNKTVPLRMSGFAHNQTTITSGDADIVLITDFSGSMKKAVGDWTQGNLGGNCDNAYTDSSLRRTLLAQCVDGTLVNTVMNYSGNRVWPVMIYDDRVEWYNNPTNAAAINGWINSYANGKGETCYACALNLAHDILQNFSNSSRKKFIIFMSDGCPTHCASGSCVSNSTVFGTQQCAGLCDGSGSCDSSNIPAQCTACTSASSAQTNAYISANRSRNELNATIYTIGFGPVNDCAYATQTLGALATIGNGTYQQSTSSAQLKLIYDNISQEILTKTNLVAQVANAIGPQTASKLFSDSYINITYSLASQYLPTQNELSLTLQSDQACSPVVSLYPQQRLVEAKAITYSGSHWSDYLSVNGVEVFNLSSFLLPYPDLGDPSVIETPVSLLTIGNNTFHLETGESATNRTGCFVNNSVFYVVSINLSTERSVVVPDAEGCIWNVQYEDGTSENITIPAAYAGANRCSYTGANITYDATDAYQLGAYNIFNRLDFRQNGKLFVNLRNEDLEVIVTTISQVPYMWGPSVVKLEVAR
jgi:hypothetical protein